MIARFSTLSLLPAHLARTLLPRFLLPRFLLPRFLLPRFLLPRFLLPRFLLALTLLALTLLALSVAPGAAAEEPVDVGATDEAALRDWAGVSLGWDVHGEAISLFKRYSIGERSAWYSGQGAGGGASVSLHFRPAAALSSGVLRWIEFELGVGNATHFVRWEEGDGDRPRTDFVDNQTSAIIGAHIASGRWSSDSGSPWSGAVLGLAWVPTYVHFLGNDDFGSGGKFHHAGVRLSVDWARVAATAKGRVPGLRAFLTWLPYVGSLPTSVSAGVGCVFY